MNCRQKEGPIRLEIIRQISSLSEDNHRRQTEHSAVPTWHGMAKTKGSENLSTDLSICGHGLLPVCVCG
jgi:hypothetical protein